MIWASDEFIEKEESTFSFPVIKIIVDGYEIPESDIISAGQISQSRPTDFTGTISGEYTFILDNSSYSYSPNKSTFIFPKQNWFRRSVVVKYGFADLDEYKTIFEGFILEWKLLNNDEEGDHVEVNCSDFISVLTERKIGIPNDDGTPNPFLHGTVVKDLIELGDLRLWSPDDSADFETGDLTQVTVTETNGGDVAAVTTSPYEGSYCAECTGNDTTQTAYMSLDGGAGIDDCMFTAYIKFTNIPALGFSGDVRFIRFRNQGGVDFMYLDVLIDGTVNVYNSFTSASYSTSWNIYNTEDAWVRVSVQYKYATGVDIGAIKVYLNGDTVMEEYVTTGNSFRYVDFGIVGLYNENLAWDIFFDAVELDTAITYPCAYYLPGEPFDSIENVWADGAILPKQKRTWSGNLPFIKQYRERWDTKMRGKVIPYDNWADYPTYGIVNIISLGEIPSGTIIGKYVKDTTNHPVDIIEDILAEVGIDDYINAASFAACKAAYPNDVTGIYFDNISADQAIADILSRMLYNLVFINNQFHILPYTGSSLGNYVKQLTESNCSSFDTLVDMKNLYTGVYIRWGWYEKDNSLFYKTEDTDLKALIGEQTQELDFTYGSNVYIDNEAVATAKADLLLKRLSGGVEQIDITGNLTLLRVDIGDGVLVYDELILDRPQIYEVYGKSVDLDEYQVELNVIKHLGEL